LSSAAAEGADLVQIFLGDPQSWKAPKPREDAELLKASDIPIYVHAPYLVNVASPNNKIRIPSRKILQQTCDAAAAIEATAVIVHGGHVTDDDEPGAGFDRWRKALEQLQTDVPVFLENTAGGDHAMARHFDTIGRLWERIGDLNIGFCLDTCHAWAAGEGLVDAVDRILAITGRIDLVHCNDSKDEAGSGRDRHANLGTGTIDPELLVAVVSAAGAPVVCETADEGRKDDIALLRNGTT
jgi:deoxyribonuclease-4